MPIFHVTGSAGANGTISPAGTQAYNFPADTIVFTAAPAQGYEVTAWVVNGQQVSAGTTLTFPYFAGGTPPANSTVEVTFDAIAGYVSSMTPYTVMGPCSSGACNVSQSFYLAYDPYSPVAVASYPFSSPITAPDNSSFPVLCQFQNPQLLPAWATSPSAAIQTDSFSSAAVINATGLIGQKGQGDFPGSSPQKVTPIPFLVISSTAPVSAVSTMSLTSTAVTLQGGGAPVAWGQCPALKTFTSVQQLAPGVYDILITPCQFGFEEFTGSGDKPQLVIPADYIIPLPAPLPLPATVSGCLQLVDNAGSVINAPVFNLSNYNGAFTANPPAIPVMQDGCGRIVPPWATGTPPFNGGNVYVATITIQNSLNSFLKFTAIPQCPQFIAVGVFKACLPCSFLYPG